MFAYRLNQFPSFDCIFVPGRFKRISLNPKTLGTKTTNGGPVFQFRNDKENSQGYAAVGETLYVLSINKKTKSSKGFSYFHLPWNADTSGIEILIKIRIGRVQVNAFDGAELFDVENVLGVDGARIGFERRRDDSSLQPLPIRAVEHRMRADLFGAAAPTAQPLLWIFV